MALSLHLCAWRVCAGWCAVGPPQMWELSLGPGESSGVHTHWLPYTFYVLNSSTLEVTAEDGQHLLTFTGSVGDAFSFDLEGDYLVDAQRG